VLRIFPAFTEPGKYYLFSLTINLGRFLSCGLTSSFLVRKDLTVLQHPFETLSSTQIEKKKNLISTP